jgi:phosphoribosylanthranilate isomerase
VRTTRIKICGLTRPQDVVAAADAGADAVGFNCYPNSPRFVSPDRLPLLAREVPAFITPVLVFVNPDAREVERALQAVPDALLQFHGDETPAICEAPKRPYLRAVRVTSRDALLDCATRFASAVAILADTVTPGFGGSGVPFDWSLLPSPAERTKPVILAGGLNAGNVAAAMRATRPYAVDVSSGVETAPGIKSAERMQQFIAAVRHADARHDES